MRDCSRRQFLQATLAGTSLLATMPRWGSGQPTAAAGSYKGNKIVPLGRTGIRVSRLAQGTGFNGYERSSEQTRRGKAAFDRLLHHGHLLKFEGKSWRLRESAARLAKNAQRT